MKKLMVTIDNINHTEPKGGGAYFESSKIFVWII
jgi:hypothetical protein